MTDYDRWLESPYTDRPEPEPCEDCEGGAYVDAETGRACAPDAEDAVSCKTCDGSGCKPEMTREDIAEVRAEREFDQMRDEGRI